LEDELLNSLALIKNIYIASEILLTKSNLSYLTKTINGGNDEQGVFFFFKS
jgi:hypothetical protein